MQDYSLLLCIFFYWMSTFSLFSLLEASNYRLRVINLEGKKYKIILYCINGNATVQNGIQIRELNGSGEHTLKHYDRYDSLISFPVYENKLKLVLKNTNLQRQAPDTLYLKLP